MCDVKILLNVAPHSHATILFNCTTKDGKDRRYSMYNFGEQQVISVGGDHAEPKLLRTAHSFKVVALGIKSFMRISGVNPDPVSMDETARNPYSIRDGPETGDSLCTLRGFFKTLN